MLRIPPATETAPVTFSLFAPLAALGAPIIRRMRAPRDPLPLPPAPAVRALPRPDVPADCQTPATRAMERSSGLSCAIADPPAASDVPAGRTDMAGQSPPDGDPCDFQAEAEELKRVHRELGFPERPMPAGAPLRAPDCREVAACKLNTYVLLTHSAPTPPMTFDEVRAVYLTMCRRDHRTPAWPPHVIGELMKIKGVCRREVEADRPDGTTSYTRLYQFGVPIRRKKHAKRKRVIAKKPAKPAAVVPLRLAA